MKHYSKKSISTDSSIMESNGPCGKIRGTIQQIIDKYESALNENCNAQDEVKLQNILQYIDHYARMNQLKKDKFPKRKAFHNNKVMNNVTPEDEADLAIANEIFDGQNSVSQVQETEGVVSPKASTIKKSTKFSRQSDENTLISDVSYLNKDVSATITKLEQDE